MTSPQTHVKCVQKSNSYNECCCNVQTWQKINDLITKILKKNILMFINNKFFLNS